VILRARSITCIGVAMALAAMLPACRAQQSGPGMQVADTANSQASNIRIAEIARGLEHPWSVALLPDGGFLVTERAGRLRRVKPDGTVSAPLAGLPDVWAQGQGGLLDLVLAPDFATSRRIYFSYSEPGDNGSAGTTAAMATLGDDAVSDVRVIYRQQPKLVGPSHFGSRIAFDGHGHVFISQGERFDKRRAQQLDNLQGKLVRLNLDGTMPGDNPFADSPGVRRVIWSYGHRNMQGLAVDPRTGTLWESEHGPRGGDEINLPQAGRNYGWPVITYGENYGGGPIGEGITRKEGMEQPLHYWVPSIAPSGMAFLTSDRYGAGWKGNLFVGSLKFGYLDRIELKDGKVVAENKLLEDARARIRDVKQGPDGLLYVLTDESNGKLLRLLPD
jgi:glucose/arabinose dehydrogenase